MADARIPQLSFAAGRCLLKLGSSKPGLSVARQVNLPVDFAAGILSVKSQGMTNLAKCVNLPGKIPNSDVVLCQILIFGWPGLEGDSPKPRGFLRSAQSSPGHQTCNPCFDKAVAALLDRIHVAYRNDLFCDTLLNQEPLRQFRRNRRGAAFCSK